MSGELLTCAAAFLRNKGKNVITETEFLMDISMDLHWMPHGDAKVLLGLLLSEKIFEKNGEYLKPTFNVADVSVPVAYRPSNEFITAIRNKRSNPPAKPAESPVKEARPAGESLLPILIAEAVDSGMEKRDFIAKANLIQKELNIDILAAGLIILRDRGVDISELSPRVYDAMSKK